MSRCRIERRRWQAPLAALLVLSGLAAWPSAPAVNAQTEVTFSFWGDPAEERAYERVIDEFEAGNPEIEVRPVYTPGQAEFQTKLATDFSAGSPPDVFLINYRRFGQYAARGALEPLEARLAASDVVKLEDFYEEPMEAFRYRGGDLTCIPQNVSSLVVYYNADLFQQYGVPLPAAGWTWDDFLAAAKALTVDLNGDGAPDQHGVGVEASFIRYAPFIWMNGGDVVDDIDNPTELTLDSPEALAAIEWFIDLGFTNHNVVPSEAAVLAEDDETRFMRGTTAMLLQSRRIVPTLRENIGGSFAWDVAALPVHPTTGAAATVLHSDAFCMAAETENKDAAWRFIEFALGPTGQTILAETGRTVPSLQSVAESPAFLGAGALGDLGGLAPPPANARAFLDTIPDMRRVPNISTWIEVEDAWNTAFKRAFYVELDIPGAIDVVEFRAKDAFERADE